MGTCRITLWTMRTERTRRVSARTVRTMGTHWWVTIVIIGLCIFSAIITTSTTTITSFSSFTMILSLILIFHMPRISIVMAVVSISIMWCRWLMVSWNQILFVKLLEWILWLLMPRFRLELGWIVRQVL